MYYVCSIAFDFWYFGPQFKELASFPSQFFFALRNISSAPFAARE